MKQRSLAWGLAILVVCSTGTANSQDDWVVATPHAQCLLEHVDAYNTSGQDVIMIVLRACPEPDATKALAALTQNVAVPGIALGTAEEGAIDDVIVYTRDELICLATLQIDLTGPVSRLPKLPDC